MSSTANRVESTMVGSVYPLAEDVSRALDGALFPLRRELLVAIARENEAPCTLVSLLHTLPAKGELLSLDQVERLLAE